MYKGFTGFHLVDAIHKMTMEFRQGARWLRHQISGLTLVAIVTIVLFLLPTSAFGIEGLTVVQQRIIAIFAFATLMWILEPVPAWGTSIAIMAMLLFFASDSGIKWLCDPAQVGTLLSYKGIMACFADPVIMLFLGGFVLAIAATKTGLDVHLAKILLKPFGHKSEMVLLGFLLITGLFSMFISNTATAAMMLSFLAPVFKQLPANGKGRIAMALSIPVAANLGGIGTPIGTPPNTIALKYLNDPEGLNLNIGFGEWMLMMVPLVILLLFISWLVIKKIFPFTQKTVDLVIEGELKRDRKTKIVIVTFIVTVLLWLLDSFTGINTYTVALLPLAIFCTTGVIDRRDLEEINWSVIWMVAGGFALGYAMNVSGLASLVVKSIPFDSFSPVLILILSGLICYALSNFISNSATAALLMPILAVVCSAMGDKLAPIGGTAIVLIGVAIASSSAMVLPISTPPNALAFATNLVKQKDMAKIGLIVGIISIVLGYLFLYGFGKLQLL